MAVVVVVLGQEQVSVIAVVTVEGKAEDEITIS